MLTIKRNQSGGAYTLVKTKRGPRARQISRDGLKWLRTKFPTDQYPALEDIPFDYDLYKELRERGDVHTRSDRPARFSPRHSAYRSTSGGPDTDTLFDDTPPMGYRPQPRPAVSTPPTPAAAVAPLVPAGGSIQVPSVPAVLTVPLVKCQGCGVGLPNGAHFCSRCGRARQSKPNSGLGSFLFGCVIATAILIALCWFAKVR